MAVDRNAPVENPNPPLTDSQLSNGAAPVRALAEERTQYLSPPSIIRIWGHRLSMLLFVFFCAVLGVVLVVFPWKDEWTNNSLVIGYPALQTFLGSGFVRGVCSGLGLLDIWIGFWEAVHYHE